MLDLKDFFHLPQLDALMEQLAAERAGLVVVAGLDPLAAPSAAGGFLPSGRATIFRILMRQILTARRSGRAIVVADARDAVRVPRQLARQVEWALVEPPYTYAGRIASAARRKPDLLVIDRLDAKTAAGALEAAQSGLTVLSQIDTVFRGAGVARHLLDFEAPRELLSSLAWIVTVQRLATLCQQCKQPEQFDQARLYDLQCRFPAISGDAAFFRAGSCAKCHYTGREGNVAAFDIFRAGGNPSALFEQASLLSLEEYILGLAMLGHVPLDDVLGLETDQLRRTYNLLTASERALAETNATLERKLTQLEAANLVLQQRTEALVSLQDISRTLVTLSDLEGLAARVCRHTRDLCGADRAILYFLQPDGTAEVLAVSGWDQALVHQRLDAAMVFGSGGLTSASGEPTPFTSSPPGVSSSQSNVGGTALSMALGVKAGLRVPLIAQHEVVGLMIVHTTQKAAFAPGEVALLQAFANQAAMALQRAGLIDALQDKIAQLEAAQVELVKKERLERELELARQVQQGLLPRIFPLMPGYAFAARCEPARRVGGDFYDVVLLDADRFGVVIADVSDKGMPAALFMALTRSLLLAESRRERSPRTVLTNVHRLLVELGQPNMYVTVFYGVVDVTTRRLTYARAGHDKPILLRNGAAQLLGGEGAFLGLLDLDEVHLSEEQIDLSPGDRLVLSTDGLVDVVAPDGRPFDLSRFIPLLQSFAGLLADELCAAAFLALAAYQGEAEQYDDMTMLVVEVK